VTGIGGPVTLVRLRVFVTDASTVGGSAYLVSNAWTESGITWANAPALPATAAASNTSTAALGTWVEWDLTSVVTADGRYSVALTTPTTNSLYLSSREGSSPPQLVVSSAPPVPPHAGFSVNTTTGYAPLSVRFTDASTGGEQWAWDFQANGSVDSTAQHPMFTYTSPGTYSVKLTVSNAAGSDTLTRTDLITVTAPPPLGPVTGTLAGAGDISDCVGDADEATARVLDGITGTVFTAGDNVYETGSATEFHDCYDPTWGRHRARTLPAPGNHDYDTPGAAGYYAYFGSAAGDPAKGYYSTDVGGWHIVILKSECLESPGGCQTGGDQEQWLRAGLAAHPATCTLAIWHHPLFSSGTHGANVAVRPLWQALYEGGADLVISGHDHDYERLAPQTATGVADASYGLRSFVVGTGGRDLRSFASIAANSEIRDSSAFGILRLTLHTDGYEWAFAPVAGSTFTDTGAAPCHAPPP
jgi:PKD repeat protein